MKVLIREMKQKHLKKYAVLLPRLLALIATFLAAVITATSHQKANILNISFEAKYSDSPALKYASSHSQSYMQTSTLIGLIYNYVLFLLS